MGRNNEKSMSSSKRKPKKEISEICLETKLQRIFHIEFLSSTCSPSHEGQQPLRYIVKIALHNLGKLLYFVLSLDQEWFQDTPKNFHLLRSFEQGDKSSIENISDELQVGQKNNVVLPKFYASFSNQKLTSPNKELTSGGIHPEIENTRLTSQNMLNFETTGNLLSYTQTRHLTSPVLQTRTSLFAKYTPYRNQRMTTLDSNLGGQQETDAVEGDGFLLSPVGSVKPLIPEHGESSGDVKTEVKKRIEHKFVDIRAMNAPSISSTTSHQSRKLEQALKMLPRFPQINLFHWLMLLFIFLSGVPLIALHFENKTILSQVEGSIETISTSIFRLVRLVDLSEYTRQIWQIKIGLLKSNRYTYLDPNLDTEEYLIEGMLGVLADLNEKNNYLREFVYKLSSNLQQEIYADQLPVFEMSADGTITSTRTATTFDMITELISEGTRYTQLDLPIDANNPYMLFCLNNTLNYVLVSSQRTIPILIQYNESQLKNQSIYICILLVCLGVIGGLVLIFLFKIVQMLRKDREFFINTFASLDEKEILNQVSQVREFISTLNKLELQTKSVDDEFCSINIKQHAFAAKEMNAKQTRKLTNIKGVDLGFVTVFLSGFLFLFTVMSAYIVLIGYVTSMNSSILTMMNLMTTSSLNIFNTNILLSTLYEYVQEDGSTGLRNSPFKQEWEATYTAMTQSQDFFVLQILSPENGLADNAQLSQMIVGDLCTALDINSLNLTSICSTMGGGAATRGMVGLNSYFLAIGKQVKDQYDDSQKTWADKYTALNAEGVINFEALYPLALEGFSWVDQMIRQEIVDDITTFQNTVIAILTVYVLFYILLGGFIRGKLTQKLKNEIKNWRRMLMQIPYPIVVESKMIKSYLSRNGNSFLNK